MWRSTVGRYDAGVSRDVPAAWPCRVHRHHPVAHTPPLPAQVEPTHLPVGMRTLRRTETMSEPVRGYRRKPCPWCGGRGYIPGNAVTVRLVCSDVLGAGCRGVGWIWERDK